MRSIVALCIALLVPSPQAAAESVMTDLGSGRAQYCDSGPTHAFTELCAGAGYFDARCDAELVAAGVCTVADATPLPTVTCTAAQVTANRCRSINQGQQVPQAAACAKYLELQIDRWLRAGRNRGRRVITEKAAAATPSTDEEPFDQ